MFDRWIEPSFKKSFHEPYVHIVFGARQTGKSTALRRLIPDAAVWLDFSDPAQRSEFLVHPEELIARCRALARSKTIPCIVVDEAQAVPRIFDAVQHLFDSEKTRWRFILCGSSARKLRTTGANLLPGRSLLHHMHSLTLAERFPPPFSAPHTSAVFPLRLKPQGSHLFPPADLVERLAYGELPGVSVAREGVRADLLKTYARVYLEEELRREALIKDWPAFVRFLELAAAESGQIVEFAHISRQAGLSQPTIKNYYQLLEDMFIGFRLPAFSGSPRKNVLSTPRFFFFDLGVRHAAAGLKPCPETALANPGPLFEQWVITEIWKRSQYLDDGKLSYFRTKSGVEVDLVISLQGKHWPIEIKWTEHPDLSDARHLQAFLKEQGNRAPYGFVICRCSQPMQLERQIYAWPWQMI